MFKSFLAQLLFVLMLGFALAASLIMWPFRTIASKVRNIRNSHAQ